MKTFVHFYISFKPFIFWNPFMRKALTLIALAASCAFATSEPQTHDGFFLSIALGMGYQDITLADAGWAEGAHHMTALTMTELATDLDVKIGGRIANNLLLHMTLTGATPTETVFDYDGNEYRANMSLLGLGATYYFGANFLATASLGLSQFKVNENVATFNATVNNTDENSQTGFGLQLGFGKEWWVSENWGIGATTALLYGFADSENNTENSSLSISLRLTATWN